MRTRYGGELHVISTEIDRRLYEHRATRTLGPTLRITPIGKDCYEARKNATVISRSLDRSTARALVRHALKLKHEVVLWYL